MSGELKQVERTPLTAVEPAQDPRILSLESLNFLATMLGGQAVPLNNPDFDETARIAGNARRELLAAMAAAVKQSA